MAHALGQWSTVSHTLSNGRCGVLPSEVTTPAGAQASVLVNDALDAGKEYVAVVVTPPTGASFFELEWDGSFEYEGPLPNSFTYQVREWGVPVGTSQTVSITVVSSTLQLKYWTGSAWASGALKRWDGATWVGSAFSRWSGSDWN